MKIFNILLLFITSCSLYLPGAEIRVIDNNLNPEGSRNQLDLLPGRGNYTYGITIRDEKYAMEIERMTQQKKWMHEHWGEPNKIYTQNGIQYLIYDKKSKLAPNYGLQFAYGEKSIKLGYKNNILVRVEAYFQDRPGFGGKNPYILPR